MGDWFFARSKLDVGELEVRRQIRSPIVCVFEEGRGCSLSQGATSCFVFPRNQALSGFCVLHLLVLFRQSRIFQAHCLQSAYCIFIPKLALEISGCQGYSSQTTSKLMTKGNLTSLNDNLKLNSLSWNHPTHCKSDKFTYLNTLTIIL